MSNVISLFTTKHDYYHIKTFKMYLILHLITKYIKNGYYNNRRVY